MTTRVYIPRDAAALALGADSVAAFLRQVPETCLVVLDEAYRAFADPAYQPDIGPLLENRGLAAPPKGATAPHS